MKKMLLGTMLLLTACAGRTNIHGSLVKPEDVDMLKVGQHTKQDVMKILGSPSTVSTLNEETWFYITETQVLKPFKEPTLKERQVVAITFLKNNKIDKIFEKDESYAKHFEPEQSETNNTGQKMRFIDQVYENLTGWSK